LQGGNEGFLHFGLLRFAPDCRDIGLGVNSGAAFYLKTKIRKTGRLARKQNAPQEEK
jgi:hypothetical protein